jgi:beta-lactam-binding protein with PASTA domain
VTRGRDYCASIDRLIAFSCGTLSGEERGIVPDLRGQDDKGTQRTLQAAGLKAQKVDTCTGADKGDAKTKRGRVTCQNPAAGQAAASGTTVEYVLAGK